MKLYKDYTKKPYSFLVSDTTLSSDNPSSGKSISFPNKYNKNINESFIKKKQTKKKNKKKNKKNIISEI